MRSQPFRTYTTPLSTIGVLTRPRSACASRAVHAGSQVAPCSPQSVRKAYIVPPSVLPNTIPSATTGGPLNSSVVAVVQGSGSRAGALGVSPTHEGSHDDSQFAGNA